LFIRKTREQYERFVLYRIGLVTRLEIGSIKSAVTEIDPMAFIMTHAMSDIHGGLVKSQFFTEFR
jgi:uncharacterized membrane-anchored protein YitT (DUF2179 family)